MPKLLAFSQSFFPRFQAVNMYTLTALFPYVGFMVASFDGGADDEDAADRAGVRESTN